ncbi:hypothetical protein ACFYNO_26875 [Kitasatospora sp. NPDC006697]|uniref:hypothetical protein n=1 Tax=Kitasatospora sp. NPDC006697 TaxID=3364020 RepID=UPI0036ADBA4E
MPHPVQSAPGAPSAASAEPAAVPRRVAALDLNLARSVPFATVCVLFGASGHLLGSGSPVPLGAMLFGWLLALAVAIRAARRERSLRAITGGLAVGQLALHLLFQLAQAVHQAQPAGRMPGMPGMPGMDATAAHPLFAVTPAMLLGHVLATVAAGWWLRQGEAALWRLAGTGSRAAAATWRCAAAVRTVRALLGAAVPAATRGRAPRFVPAAPPSRPPGRPALRHSLARRGPPVPVAR